MRTLIQTRDLKTLLGGVSIAAATGLFMGVAMYPDLNQGGVRGPQMLLGGGARSEPQARDPGLGAYHGRVPDYVVGTDALKPPQYEVMAYADPAEQVAADTGESGDVMAYEAPPDPQPRRWDEPREAVRYPSEAGNTPYEGDLPAPPEPPRPDEAPLAD